jgi:hypothetical protein
MRAEESAQLVVGVRHEILVAAAVDGADHPLGFIQIERR